MNIFALSDIKEMNDHAIILDGYDKAIIGYDLAHERLIYDRAIMIDITTKEMLKTHNIDEASTIAEEYLEYNVFSAYFGQFTPIFLEKVNNET